MFIGILLTGNEEFSLKLELTYNEAEYVIAIPAGAALDNDILWYGPLYQVQQYGNSAGTGVSAAAGYIMPDHCVKSVVRHLLRN